MAIDIGQALAMVAQALGETNGRLRQMADPALAAITGFYKEVNRLVDAYDKKKAFGLRPISKSWAATISAAATSSAQQDDKVANNEDFVVSEVRGYLSFNDWTSEVALNTVFDGGGTGKVPPSERVIYKAHNCKINVTNQDLKVAVTDLNDVVLASILAQLGAAPLRYGGEGRPAWIVPHGQTIRVKATLNKSDAASVGASTDYGITASGVLVTRQQ